MKVFSRNTRSKFLAVFLALGMAALIFTVCSEQPDITGSSRTEAEPVRLGRQNQQVQAVMRVQNKHTDDLMKIPGVTGTGTGLNEEGELAVVVYTIIPDVPGIPRAIENIPVYVKVTGLFVVQADPKSRFPRPVPIGVSTGHPDITAGTLGCRVRDSQGNVYALSNNHVYANVNKASIGDNVLQPGKYDGGVDPDDAIGTLFDYEPILLNGPDNYMDAAIAATTTGYVGYSTPSGDGYGTPSATIAGAYIGQKVQKYGRTTVWTHGEVSEINVTVDVCYTTRGPFQCKDYGRFVDQITITPGTFSDGGDSGSLIVTDDSKKNPVALLFAGSSTHTIGNPIHYVLDRFNVTVDDGSGAEPPNNPPSADFSYSVSGLEVSFTDKSTDSDGSIVSWNWNFGDGSSSTVQNPTHTYGTEGTYTVSLTVTDDDGATDTASKDVTVSSSANDPPSANFSYSVSGLEVSFTDESTDSDGNIVSWSWDFGDGAASTQQHPVHTFAADGTYTVTLDVTDDGGASDSISKDVTVTSGATGINLTATGWKYRGLQKVDLAWTGASGTSIEVYRDGVRIAVTENDGAYTDNIDKRGGGTYVYQIFDGSVWSNEATVVF